MPIPTEPIGSIPRPRALVDAFTAARDPDDPRIQDLCEAALREQLGTTDDCGFSPFCDDFSTTRETAFAKIRARVLGTALAEQALGGA